MDFNKMLREAQKMKKFLLVLHQEWEFLDFNYGAN